mmetsp:Transcript_31088/g.56361  ORF Transcript_31088/g.56361 Transcript_31088/m.56361 type:complete len:161 (-) Transcript_31088:41-523(-)
MGNSGNKCCASERDRGPPKKAKTSKSGTPERQVRFDGTTEDTAMTSSQKVQVLRRLSRSDSRNSLVNEATALRKPEQTPEPNADDFPEEIKTRKKKASLKLQEGGKIGNNEGDFQDEKPATRNSLSPARPRGSRLSKGGRLSNGEGAKFQANEDESLFEF